MFLTHIKISNQQAEQRRSDSADCNHGGRLSTDGDAVRCCDCLGQLAIDEIRQLDVQLRHAEQFAYLGAHDMMAECAAIVRLSQALRP